MNALARVMLITVAALFFSGSEAAAIGIWDESTDGDLGSGSPPNSDLFIISSNGVFEIFGTGIDVVDDGDSFNFTVTGGTFDFVLSGPVAEFKWLDPQHDVRGGPGSITELTGADLVALGNAAGDYSTHMFMGSTGSWTATITVTGIPEPGTALLLGSGLVGMGVFGRRARHQR